MQTLVVNTDNSEVCARSLPEAAAALRAGELVIFPTETVYGVGANASLATAVARLRDVKGREQAQPFTVHLGERAAARRYVSESSPMIRRLVRKAWPGPLTVLWAEPEPPRTEIARELPPEQLAEVYRGGNVGLRCPDHAVASRLLMEAGVPVIASSANRRGAPPPFDCASALHELNGQVAYALDAGRTRHNAASTIVQVRGNSWQVVRTGAIDERTVGRWATSAVLFICSGNSCRSPMAEHLFRHHLGKRLGLSREGLAAAGYQVSSAGTLGVVGAPASEGARAELRRRGLDLAAHRSQPLTAELVHRADRIYVMTQEHRQAVLSVSPGAGARVELLSSAGAVADPMGGPAEQYAECAAQIEAAVLERLEEFLDEDRDW